MNKQIISFDKFNILRGKAKLLENGLNIIPDEDGFVSLRLNGEKGSIAGISWEDDHYLIVDMLADMDAMTNIDLFFIKNGESTAKNCINCRMIPGRRVKMAINLKELKSTRYFIETLPGMLKGHVACLPTSIKDIDSVEILVHPGRSSVFSSFHIYEAYPTKTLPDMTVIGEPRVDEFGQWIQKEWKGKTKDISELSIYLIREYIKSEKECDYPEGWSDFGGYKKIRFDATGYFYTHNDGNRWWLVDPEGYAFFSNGMCYGSRMGVFGFTDKMENMFSWLPDKKDPVFKDAWTTADRIDEFVKRNGKAAGKNRYLFNFARANFIRVFGPENWWDAWVRINGARLKRWGFNTIGVGVNNYNDERVMDFLKKVKMPFVWTLKNFPLTKKRVFRDFPDVYSEEYKQKAREFAINELSPFSGNPYLIGYFVTNEPEWKFQKVNLAEQTLASPEILETKKYIVKMLKEKYRSIDKLNEFWNRSFDSFEDLYNPIENVCSFSKRAKIDMEALHAELLRRYSFVVGEALNKVDPNHLNLGMRYSSASKSELAGCEYCDVFSFNRYNFSPTEPLDECSSQSDIPMIIGEWHIGGMDKGLFAHGLVASPNQEERGKACEYYMQHAMSHKNCVGIHYFEMNDQPLLGRFDGECMQHGVIDVCNRPYEELVAHFINTNHHMYEYVTGELKPTDIKGRIIKAR